MSDIYKKINETNFKFIYIKCSKSNWLVINDTDYYNIDDFEESGILEKKTIDKAKYDHSFEKNVCQILENL